MFGLTIVKKKNLNKLTGDLIKFSLKLNLNSLELRLKDLKIASLKDKLNCFGTKEFRKKELEQYFTESRANGLNPREHLEVSWKEYQSLFQKESCETKKNLLFKVSTQELDSIQSQIMQSMKEDFEQKNKESLLKSVKEILDWYKFDYSLHLRESKGDIKDMFLNLEIAYINILGTFGEHKSDSGEIIKEI